MKTFPAFYWEKQWRETFSICSWLVSDADWPQADRPSFQVPSHWMLAYIGHALLSQEGCLQVQNSGLDLSASHFPGLNVCWSQTCIHFMLDARCGCTPLLSLMSEYGNWQLLRWICMQVVLIVASTRTIFGRATPGRKLRIPNLQLL